MTAVLLWAMLLAGAAAVVRTAAVWSRDPPHLPLKVTTVATLAIALGSGVGTAATAGAIALLTWLWCLIASAIGAGLVLGVLRSGKRQNT